MGLPLSLTPPFPKHSKAINVVALRLAGTRAFHSAALCRGPLFSATAHYANANGNSKPVQEYRRDWTRRRTAMPQPECLTEKVAATTAAAAIAAAAATGATTPTTKMLPTFSRRDCWKKWCIPSRETRITNLATGPNKTLSNMTGKDLDKDSHHHVSLEISPRTWPPGDENYEFGDLTRARLQELEVELGAWREENLNTLPNNLFRQTFGNLNPQQRRELIVAVIRHFWLRIPPFAC